MSDFKPRQPTDWQDELRHAIDPFGMLESCWGAHRAWMTHPRELAAQLTQLSAGMAALQVQTLQRALGYTNGELVTPVSYDERFQDPVWNESVFFDHLKEVYLLYTRWLEDAVYETPQLPEKERRKAGFLLRQVLNALAPSNFFWANPAAMLRFLQTGGRSLVDGAANLLKDFARGTIRMTDESTYQVGENLAITPGAVVFRNRLVEVIQYEPTTEKVHAIPLVLVAPWINKYYILDLNPAKSLVRYLTEQGFTVFVTSWKNPDEAMSTTRLDDYMLEGVLQTVEVARSICGVPQVHLTGYCIGGTIVAALMAWLNHRDKGSDEQPVAHWTLFASLVDFADAGEIDVFIDEATLEFLQRRMARKGSLDGQDMANSFRALRPNSLIWHYFVHNYLLGEDPPRFDVLYWNMDTTRMPEAMHGYYLRECYLHNRLIEKDALELGGRSIDLGRIVQPLYVVGAEQDHIAPWRSAFRIGDVVKSPVRYVLATSGHILGIISPPVKPPKRRYWVAEATGGIDAETWRSTTPKVAGSWWDDWSTWLKMHCGELQAPPNLGNEEYPRLEAAPGQYVMER